MTTTVTSSIGNGTRDYTTIQAWEDAAPADLVAANEVWKGELYKEGGGSDGEWAGNAVSIQGSVSDPTRHKWLTAAAGESFADSNANQLRYIPANGVAIRGNGSYSNAYGLNLTEAHFLADRLQITAVPSTVVVSGENTGAARLQNCFIYANLGPAVHARNMTAVNTVFIGSVFAQITTSNFDSCTLRANNITQLSTSGYGAQVIFRNCAVFGYATAGPGVSSSSSFVATDLATFPGTSNLTGLVAANQFESPTVDASLNLRLKAGSALIGAGTTTGAPPLDIFGTVRSAVIDIGVHEWMSAVLMPTLGTPTFVPGSVTSSGFRPRFPVTWA